MIKVPVPDLRQAFAFPLIISTCIHKHPSLSIPSPVQISFISSFLDTYVKVAMFNSIGQQLSKCKTSIRRNMVDPEFNETFVFQIIEFELPSVSIMFSVVNIKKMRRKEIIGWFSIGHDSTGNEEDAHWRAVMNARGQPIRRWHILSSVDF